MPASYSFLKNDLYRRLSQFSVAGWAPCPSQEDAVRVLHQIVRKLPHTSLLHLLWSNNLLPLQGSAQGVQMRFLSIRYAIPVRVAKSWFEFVAN